VLSLLPERLDRIQLLGAHCDDIAIGAGGSLLELCRAHPGVAVSALVLTGGGSLREEEERAALAAFCPGANLDVTVLDLPDGRVPTRWERAKGALEEVRAHGEPDLVLAPSPHDAHQDHRTLAKIAPTVFRDHLTLGYEILKWESDLAQPNRCCGRRSRSSGSTTAASATAPGSTTRRSAASPAFAACSATPATPRRST
jgi:LmbE family N-acetylglucosaminyl deacetylase